MKRSLCLLSLFAVIVACNESSIDEAKSEIESVIFKLPHVSYVSDIETKTSITDNGSGFDQVWAADDTVGIYPSSGSQVYFAIGSGVDSDYARFDGGGWAFAKGLDNNGERFTYSSYYPFIGDIYLNRNRIPVSFENQVQNGVSSMSHVDDYFYMKASNVYAESGALTFEYQNLCPIVRVKATLTPGTYTKLSIKAESECFVLKGHYDLMSQSSAIVPTKSSDIISVDLKNFTISQTSDAYIYLVVAPVVFSNANLTVTITDSQRTDFECKKTINRTYVGGMMYGLTCSTWTKVPQNMGVGIGDWETGEDEGGVCN